VYCFYNFCHNKELVIHKSQENYTKKQVIEFLKKRQGLLEGVCISGGEPLLSIEKDFLRQIKKLNYKIKIDTNGSNPEILKDLIHENLIDYVAMDVKAPKHLYDAITQTKINTEKIEKSMRIISQSNVEYEFRTTIIPQKSNNIIENIKDIAKWIIKITNQNNHNYYIQKFIPREQKLINPEYENLEETPESLINDIYDEVKILLPSVKMR
jgi:pyruvate formate lyase activating enzyme